MAYLRNRDQRGLSFCTVAIGFEALKVLTTGIDNIAIGTTSMDALTTGACNIAMGLNALGANTIGCQNVAIGHAAMSTFTTAATADNVAIGTCAMAGGSGGSDTASFNVAIGLLAGAKLTTGGWNIGIGKCAGCAVTSTSCTINIGKGVNNTTANTTCIGGTCVMATQFTATSDCRSKKNIKDLPYGLDFINLLRPVSYKWKPQADKLDKDGNLIEEGEKYHTHQRTMFGLLGQQVREATKKLGLSYNDFAGFHDQEYENKDNPDWKTSYTMEDKTIQLTYDDFIAPLIKSVQELSAEVTELKAQLKTT